MTMPGQESRRKMPFRPRSGASGSEESVETSGMGGAAAAVSEAILPESVRLPGEFVFDGRRLQARGGQSLAP